jgi:hypothetical protein
MLRLASQLAGVGSFCVGVVALNAGVGGLNCAPTVYGKFEVSGHIRDIVPDPKFSLKFGNAAFSAMFIHKLHYKINGKHTTSLAPVFETLKTVQLCTESVDLMAQDFSDNPRAWKHGGLVALAVVRPMNSDSNAWTTEVVDALRKHKVSIVVTTSFAPDGIACWLTTKTSELSVISLAA